MVLITLIQIQEFQLGIRVRFGKNVLVGENIGDEGKAGFIFSFICAFLAALNLISFDIQETEGKRGNVN